MTVTITPHHGRYRYHIDGTPRWVAGMNGAQTYPVVTAWSDHMGLSLRYLPGVPGFVRRAAEQGTRERGRRRLEAIGGTKRVADLFLAMGGNTVKMRLDREVNALIPWLLAIPVALENSDGALDLLGLEAPDRRALLITSLEERLGQCAGATIIGAQWGNEPLWNWTRSGGEGRQDELIALFKETSAWWRDHLQARLPGVPTMSPGHAGGLEYQYPRLWDTAISEPWDVLCIHNYGGRTPAEVNTLGASLRRPILVGEYTRMSPLPRRQAATQKAMRVPKDGGEYPDVPDQDERADWTDRHIRALARQQWVLGECWHSMWDHRGRKWGASPIDFVPDDPWIRALCRGRQWAQGHTIGGSA